MGRTPAVAFDTCHRSDRDGHPSVSARSDSVTNSLKVHSQKAPRDGLQRRSQVLLYKFFANLSSSSSTLLNASHSNQFSIGKFNTLNFPSTVLNDVQNISMYYMISPYDYNLTPRSLTTQLQILSFVASILLGTRS
jgi:hypothetical protein